MNFKMLLKNLEYLKQMILILVIIWCGYFQLTEVLKMDFRCSAAVGYLNPVKKRKFKNYY